MASTTDNTTLQRRDEDEPLLGRAGDASQQRDKPLAYNLFLGTAVITQLGIWILTGIVWGSVLSSDLILFSTHPLLNMAGILFLTQAVLVLQPTHTQSQKITGTYYHLVVNDVGILCLIAGLILIEYNKIKDGNPHFESPHAIMGLVTYIVIGIQAFVGATAFLAPGLYGGVGQAKSLYKYHRMSGYVLITLMLATVCAATETGFNLNVLHMKLWSVIVASVLVLVGLVARVKKSKLGL